MSVPLDIERLILQLHDELGASSVTDSVQQLESGIAEAFAPPQRSAPRMSSNPRRHQALKHLERITERVRVAMALVDQLFETQEIDLDEYMSMRFEARAEFNDDVNAFKRRFNL